MQSMRAKFCQIRPSRAAHEETHAKTHEKLTDTLQVNKLKINIFSQLQKKTKKVLQKIQERQSLLESLDMQVFKNQIYFPLKTLQM